MYTPQFNLRQRFKKQKSRIRKAALMNKVHTRRLALKELDHPAGSKVITYREYGG